MAYHDACHLCHGQQIRSQPRALLAMIPGVELVPLEESEICCGAAGTYNLTQPEMSERLGKRKMDHIEATGAEMVVTGNVGCILQIARKIKERGSPIEVAHPVDLLDRSYRGGEATRAMSPTHGGKRQQKTRAPGVKLPHPVRARPEVLLVVFLRTAQRAWRRQDHKQPGFSRARAGLAARRGGPGTRSGSGVSSARLARLALLRASRRGSRR